MSVSLMIAIPTHNRSEWLGKALDSILANPPALLARVNVTVLDNASTDGTTDVVAARQALFPNLDYVRRTQNIGGEANIIKASWIGTCDYNLVLGDDDQIAPYALATIFAALDDLPDLLILNRVEYDGSFTTISNENALDIKESRLYLDPDTLLADFDIKIGMISGLVFKRSMMDHLDPADYADFYYGQLFHLYRTMPRPCQVKVVAERVVLCRVPPVPIGVDPVMMIEGFDRFFAQLAMAGYDQILCSRLAIERRKESSRSLIKICKHGDAPYIQTLRLLAASARPLRLSDKIIYAIFMLLPASLFRHLYRSFYGTYS